MNERQIGAKVSLAVKYRPKCWEDVTEQSVVKDILENQVRTKTVQSAYLFTGPSGTGKTTSARIFANMINDGKGKPIEVDAASNSGVDNVRQIIEDAKRIHIDVEYSGVPVFINNFNMNMDDFADLGYVITTKDFLDKIANVHTEKV